MKKMQLFGMLVLALSLVACGAEKPKPNLGNTPLENSLKPEPKPDLPKELNYTIVPGERVGEISASSTKAQLIEAYGKENISFEEGAFEEATYYFSTLYKGTDKELEIFWADGTFSSVLYVEMYGDASPWKTQEGIGLGSSIADVEKVNSKPFKLYGYHGAEGSGMSFSWEGGMLHKDLTLAFNGGMPEDVPENLAVDADISSNTEGLQKINPKASYLITMF